MVTLFMVILSSLDRESTRKGVDVGTEEGILTKDLSQEEGDNISCFVVKSYINKYKSYKRVLNF